MTNSKAIGITEAAKILGVTRQAVYVAVMKKRISAKKSNAKNWVTTLEELENYKKNKYSRAKSKYNGELIFDKEKGFYSIQETAKLLRLPAQKLYYATRSGALKSHRKGSAWVVHIDDIRDYEKTYLTREQKKAI